MKLSKKSLYALRALRLLTENYASGRMSASKIAKQENISEKVMEQVLTALSKHGVLISERGKDGGYRLRRKPHEINLGDVIRAIDGPLAPIPCASRTAPHHDDDCPLPYDSCWIRLLMLRVRDNISDIVDKISLEEMLRFANSLEEETPEKD